MEVTIITFSDVDGVFEITFSPNETYVPALCSVHIQVSVKIVPIHAII